MKKQLLCLLFSLWAITVCAQQIVTGKVISADDNEPVIGASVTVKGDPGTGSITDFDGKYSIKVPNNSTLVFTYVGMEPQDIKVDGRTTINVTMKTSSIMVDEVVVTAMGVTTQKKKLNYAVQSLDSDELMGGANTNLVSALQGKVSGLSVTSNGGSPNASSQILIRGISSINNVMDNQPLLIIDGMPVSGAGIASQINPSDVESMTVLKGAAASALYGQEASNGVILITTKRGQAGKLIVNANASVEVNTAMRLPKVQQTYLPGSRGVFNASNVVNGWGPMIEDGAKTFDNIDAYFQHGFTQKYDMSASGGTDRFVGFGSLAYSMADGIVYDDYQNRMNLMLKGSYKVTKTLEIGLSANVINTVSRGGGIIPSSVYNWPIDMDISQYQNNGMPNWIFPTEGLTDNEMIALPASPMWSRYMDSGQGNSTRNMLGANIQWKPIAGLEVAGKFSWDENHAESESITAPKFLREDFENSGNVDEKYFGSIDFSQSRSRMLTLQAIVNYDVTIAKNFNIHFLGGYELKERKSRSVGTGGDGFQIFGFENLSNITAQEIGRNTSLIHSHKRMMGYFGELRFDYKGIAYVSGTAREDFTSTLSTRHYFYPSVTGGLIFTELFKLSSDVFSYGKIRGNWAKVGKDAQPYAFDERYVQKPAFPDQGFATDPTKSRAVNLDPEMSRSWEIGLDLRFFSEKTKIDVAYYNTKVDNQILYVRVSPTQGTILAIRNEGNIENKGVELQISQEIMKNKDWIWNANVNFGFNRGKVKGLPEGQSEMQGNQFGDAFTSAYLGMSTTSITGKDYSRTPNGDIICDENGYPVISPTKSNYIGDREPKFLMGITSMLQWKNLSVSFLLDARKGGKVLNVTQRSLFSNGQSLFTEKYRNREVVVKGMVQQADGSYVPNEKPILLDQKTLIDNFSNITSNFLEDGSYLRLSYVTVSYDFSSLLKNSVFNALRLSLTGRNLFLATKYTGCDPQVNAGVAGGTGNMGVDNFSIPSTRSFNVSINATF